MDPNLPKEKAAINRRCAPEQEQAPPPYDDGLSAMPAPEPDRKASGPTADLPFNFPTAAPPPSYADNHASSSSHNKPIAIPQTSPETASPFVLAYPPSLLRHGITSESWYSFLNTLSAFLTANVSERALAHAADTTKKLADTPKEIAKDVYSHAKDIGKGISRDAKSGNVVGVTLGAVAGSVSIPLSAALGIVRAIVTLPSSTISAVSQRPQTPRDRATAYLAVANKDWFKPRNLSAKIMSTEELGRAVGTSAATLMQCANTAGDSSAGAQLRSLQLYLAPLELKEDSQLTIGRQNLWLVLTLV